MAAVVHYGGAGTTAEGLRAGKPTAVFPSNFGEQLFWGRRVRALGAGFEPVPQKGSRPKGWLPSSAPSPKTRGCALAPPRWGRRRTASRERSRSSLGGQPKEPRTGEVPGIHLPRTPVNKVRNRCRLGALHLYTRVLAPRGFDPPFSER
jgi:hypothetical protein